MDFNRLTKKISKIVCLSLCLIFSACFWSDESGNDNYFVKFNLNGTDYEYNSGVSKDSDGRDYSGDASGFKVTDEGVYAGIMIIGTPYSVDLNETFDDACVLVIADNDGTYTGGQPCRIKIDGIFVWRNDYGTTVSISKIGTIGDTIIGTFSGTDSYGNVVTDGEFRVKRLPDYLVAY